MNKPENEEMYLLGSTENPKWRYISRNVCKIRNGQITTVDTLFDGVHWWNLGQW